MCLKLRNIVQKNILEPCYFPDQNSQPTFENDLRQLESSSPKRCKGVTPQKWMVGALFGFKNVFGDTQNRSYCPFDPAANLYSFGAGDE